MESFLGGNLDLEDIEEDPFANDFNEDKTIDKM